MHIKIRTAMVAMGTVYLWGKNLFIKSRFCSPLMLRGGRAGCYDGSVASFDGSTAVVLCITGGDLVATGSCGSGSAVAYGNICYSVGHHDTTGDGRGSWCIGGGTVSQVKCDSGTEFNSQLNWPNCNDGYGPDRL
jgi:hypothetical protein